MKNHFITLKRGGGNPLPRDSNLELYRILVMLSIIAHHYVVNSGLYSMDSPVFQNPTAPKALAMLVFGAWGKTGINCFVLITGWFMCVSPITPRKFVKLLGEVLFYRFSITIIFWLTGYDAFSFGKLIKMLIPIREISNGFTACFLMFYLLIPFLTLLVRSMTEKQHLRLLALLGFLYVFLGTVPFFSVNMNYVSWFSVLFLLASYLRLYPKNIFDSVRFWGWMTLASVLLSAFSVVACTWFGILLSAYLSEPLSYYFVTDSNTFLAVLTGLCSFLFFKNLRVRPNRWINAISSTTFGVFLIHTRGDTMRQWLWHDLLKNTAVYPTSMAWVHAIGSVLGIFIVCSLIDFCRIRLIERPFLGAWNKLSRRSSPRLRAWEEAAFRKFHISG